MAEPRPRRAADRELLGKGSVYTLATLVQLLASVVVLPVLTRTLPQREFGLVVGGTITVQLVWMLAGLGLPAVVTRCYFAGPDGPERARGLVTVALAAAATVVAAAVGSAPLWRPLVGYPAVTAGLVAAVAGGGLFAVANAAQAWQRARRQAGRFVAVAVVTVVVGQGAGLASVLRTPTPSHADYLAGVLLGHLAGAAVAVATVRPVRPTRAEVWDGLRIGLPVVPHLLGMYVMTSMDRLVLAGSLGAEAVARYQVAYFVGALPITLTLAVNNAWAPLVLGTPEPARWHRLRETTRTVALLAVAAAVGVAAASRAALAVAAPAGYDRAALVPVVLVVALAVPAYVGYLAHVHVLFATGRTARLTVAAPGAAAAALLANLVLVPRWGLVGAAWSGLVGYVVLAVVVATRARRLAPVAGVLPVLAGPAVGLAGVIALLALTGAAPATGAALLAAAVGAAVVAVRTGRLRLRSGGVGTRSPGTDGT